MKKSRISNWIQAFLESDPPRSKSIVMTLFGDSIAPHGGSVWLGSLITLLAPFGISDRLVRTSVFRLTDEGWLEAKREGRRSAYALTPAGLRRFEQAYQRIYAHPSPHWSGSWTLVIAAPGMLAASERARLRKELLWEGYSMLAPGVFARPSGNAKALDEILGSTAFSGKLFVCQASDLNHLKAYPLRDYVEHGWELDAVMQNYRHFIENFSAVKKLLSAKQTLAPEQAFMIRSLLMHAFRRLQLHDPLLPLELLPKDWPGTAAYELCRQIYQATYAAGEQHLIATLSKEDESATRAAAYFYRRFDGLI